MLLLLLFLTCDAINLDWIPADDEILPASKEYRERLSNLCLMLEKNGFQNLHGKEGKMKKLCFRLKEEELWKNSSQDDSYGWVPTLIISVAIIFLFRRKIVNFVLNSTTSANRRLPSPDELEKIRQSRLESINQDL